MDLRSKIVISVFSILVVIYLSVLYGVPAILSSEFMHRKYEKFLSQKTGFKIDIDAFKFKTSYNLSFEISAKEISSQKDEIQIKNIEYKSKPLSIMPESLNAENISIDVEKFKPLLSQNKPKEKKKFDVNKIYFPLINIDNVYIKVNKKLDIRFTDIKSWKEASKINCRFFGKINVANAKSPIIIGQNGGVVYDNGISFKNLSVVSGNSRLFLSGDLKNIGIRGKDLPANELASTFLFYYKLKYPHRKNFLENFKNFSGTIDTDLAFSMSEGISGKCHSKNLSADFSTYEIPVKLPKTNYYFFNRKMIAKTQGSFGGEKVYTDVEINGVATDDLHTVGNVKSKLTNKFAKKYFPKIMIDGGADVWVKYEVNNRDVDIDYYLTLEKGSNITSKHGALDNIDKVRKLHTHTFKKGPSIKLTKYSYQLINGGQRQVLFQGNGEFKRINKKYKPILLTFKTGSNVQISSIKSFIRNYFTDGTINADLQYDFIKKHLEGRINLKNIKHRNFIFLNKVDTDISKNSINIISEGKFFSEPINFSVNAENDFTNGLVINDINIRLKKYMVEKGEANAVKSDIEVKKTPEKSLNNPQKGYNITVKNGKILVDEIVHSSFYLKDVCILGKMKDNIVDFSIPQTNYANGKLEANGKYDVIKHDSDIYFSASDINSNVVVTNIFKLPDQFMGKADATLHLITKNRLNDNRAYATFAIKDGYMPKLGSYEFILNRPSKLPKILFMAQKQIKFTLEKITNIDFSKPNTVYSNLKGSFTMNNDNVENIKIFSTSDYLSLFMEGQYNIDTQFGDINIWGRHNRFEEKKVKIYSIPLSLLYKLLFKAEYTKDLHEDKIKLVPPIKAKPHEELIFRVDINGNLNSNNLKFQFKDLRSKR